MDSYKFKYRKKWIWKSLTAIGHKYYGDMDRMDIFQKDGSVLSLAGWSKYDLFLGTDWVLFTKKQMEKESGQRIDLAVQEG